MVQQRLFWAVQAAGIKPIGNVGAYNSIHGLQSIGITTTFNLEQVFEMGQISIYENIENVPDIEVTLEKVIDGYPLIYHLCTQGASTGTLSGRSNQRCIVALSVFSDVQDSASGTALATVEMSGMYVSSLSYTIPNDGNCTESVTLVGNNKLWSNGGGSKYGTAYSGTLFDNKDQPAALNSASGGVQRRENVIFNSVSDYTVLPVGIPGISSSGTNDKVGDQYGCHVQQVTFSADLGRDAINELGRRGPYHRYANFPVEVTTEIEIIALSGDMQGATEVGINSDGSNINDSTIRLVLQDGTNIYTGTKNKLASINYGGADAGGGNATITFSYTTFNELVVKHPQDPSGL